MSARLYITGAVLALSATFGGSALAAETVVTLERGLAATLNVPDGATAAPAVLMLHGFGSSRNEVGDLYAREAAALAAKGVASLRLDFAGFGKSDGDTGLTTVDGQLADAETALTYLGTVANIDHAKTGVLGFSLGGGIAILLAAAHPDQVQSLATWSSVGDFGKDFRSSLSEATFEKAAKEGIVGLDLGWRTIALKKDFFDSLDRSNLNDAIAKVKAPYLAIAGSEDFSAAYAEKLVAASTGAPKEAVILPGEDHIYRVLSADQAGADKVVSTTADWFANTLK
jgi:pimeloyl-ACP methyl ester carboxylesterase